MKVPKNLMEGRHKAGCQCGFCKNMGKFGKKADDKPEGDDEDKTETKTESRAGRIVSRLLDS
jgi:hypothetical protein